MADYNDDDEECRPWRRRILKAVTWGSTLRITLLLLLLAAVVIACFTLPVEKILKDFLLWVKQDLGPWGPLVLAVAYIPLTVLAVPASVLTLGGGYLFGLPVGFVADSIGATVGAGAAFLLGRTIGRSFVISKLKDYPQFRSVAVATRRSGFKIVFLLRLVPLLPFNMLNYLLSVTPVPLGEYMLASWLGMMPITLALVYVGTTLKDLSDVTHGWSEFSKTRWALIISGFAVSGIPEQSPPCMCSGECKADESICGLIRHLTALDDLHAYMTLLTDNIMELAVVVLMICVTKVAKAALEKSLAENEDIDAMLPSAQLPVVAEPTVDLNQPLIIKIDPSQEHHEK
ncbi:hypothetical protein CJ030_MR5G023165 [Morella rubra]|uniref:VTT domain-containing protein n=1 Tax=Morella rubra TaxID=262757 RepID=A0A6A1VN03_9ROSI|nr:hypothetical protein CJ030_MR5G023165 [Morella rubra]